MDKPRFKIFRPSERLKPFVRYYWILKSPAMQPTLTFPIGYPQLIFHRGARFHIPEPAAEQAQFTISGQVNFPAEIQSHGSVETIVVVFHPHAAGTVFNIPVSAFYNQEIDGYSLGDLGLNRMADEVLHNDDSEDTIRLIERCLELRLNECGLHDFNRIGASLRELFHNRIFHVEEMAHRACLSRKQFERIFLKAVGMKPKEYSSVARFQKSLWLMQNGNQDFADISYACGYSDQSHFIREFRRFSGFTPTGLLKKQPVYSDLFSCPV